MRDNVYVFSDSPPNEWEFREKTYPLNEMFHQRDPQNGSSLAHTASFGVSGKKIGRAVVDRVPQIKFKKKINEQKTCYFTVFGEAKPQK
jgi:hypothetical protein